MAGDLLRRGAEIRTRRLFPVFHAEPAARQPWNFRGRIEIFQRRGTSLQPYRRFSKGALQKDSEPPRSRMMAQLSQGLGLDLTYALPGDGERLAHLLQRQFIAVLQTKTHLNDSFLARRKRLQHGGQMFLQVEMNGSIRRRNDALVLNKVTEVRLFIFSDRSFEGHGLLRDLLRFADRVDGKIHAPREFLGSRLPPEFLH